MAHISTFLVEGLTLLLLISLGCLAKEHPNAHLSADQIIEKAGYPVETYYVITEDGYNLTLFRIPHGINKTVATKPPVIIQHGFFCSANDWLLNPTNNTLPFQLADAGYDVFLSNIRGNNYSANNINPNGLNSQTVEYYNFSFHEMGQYDVPAIIDTVLNMTKHPKVNWIGHSMGTTMFYITMFLHPKYNAKVQTMHSLAPVAFCGNVTSPIIRITAPLTQFDTVYVIFTFVGQGQVVPAQLLGFFHMVLPSVCIGIPDVLCQIVTFLIGGYDPYQVQPGEDSNMVGHTPSNSSVRSFVHFAQMVNKPRTFRQYDWGPQGNRVAYNQSTPPDYDLTAVTAPVYLYWGQGDAIATPKNNATKHCDEQIRMLTVLSQ